MILATLGILFAVAAPAQANHDPTYAGASAANWGSYAAAVTFPNAYQRQSYLVSPYCRAEPGVAVSWEWYRCTVRWGQTVGQGGTIMYCSDVTSYPVNRQTAYGYYREVVERSRWNC